MITSGGFLINLNSIVMKTESENVQRWDDIVFENRNKAYGAYAIRKNYYDNILKAEAISIGLGLLIFIIPILLRDEQTIVPVIKDPDDGIVLRQYDNIKPIDPPKRTQPIKRVSDSIIPTHVTTEEIIEKPIEQLTTATSSTGSQTGTVDPGAETFVESGTGITPIIDEKKPFSVVEIMPEYEGGDAAMMKFIQGKMRYPGAAIRKKDEGTVYVSFVISADGSVTNVEVMKGVSKECDQEAVRVISMMDRWKPGIQNKMPVPVKKVLPITFKLES